MKYALTLNFDSLEELQAYLAGDGDADQDGGTASTSDVDSAGQPYNPAIHSAGRKLNKDGTWRVKRNAGTTAVTPPPTVTNIAPPPVMPVSPVAVAMPAPVPPPIMPPAPVAMPAPVPPPIMPPAPPMNMLAPGMSFPEFIQRVGAAMQAGKFGEGSRAAEYINSVCAHFGIVGLNELSTDPVKLPAVISHFVSNGLI